MSKLRNAVIAGPSRNLDTTCKGTLHRRDAAACRSPRNHNPVMCLRCIH